MAYATVGALRYCYTFCMAAARSIFSNEGLTSIPTYKEGYSERVTELHAPDFLGAIQVLKNYGVFEKRGIFLTDSDYTLRQSHRGGLSGHFDHFDAGVQDALTQIARLSHWKTAIITDQPDRGHQLAALAGKLFGYQPLLQFAKEHGIPVLGGYNDPFRFFLRERMQYKHHPRAIKETLELLDSFEWQGKEVIVVVGDRQADMVFGGQIAKKLQEQGYAGKFYFVKIDKKFL